MHFPEKSHLLELLTNRCNSLRIFKQIQTQFLTRDLLLRCDNNVDDLIINKIVTFLSKSSDFASYSCKFLQKLNPSLTSFPYNTLLSNYAISDKPRVTILVYKSFLSNGFSPDTFTFPPVLKACGKFSGINEGIQIHGIVTKSGFLEDTYVANSVLNLYGLCGELTNASKVFDEMSVRDVVSWTGVITGFSKAGLYKEALHMFLKMDVEANSATYVCALVSSGRIRCLRLGKGIHGLILKKASSLISLEIGNALIDMYVKCEELDDAMRIFEELGKKKDNVSWNSMISGLVQCNKANEAIGLFSRMQDSGIKPDGYILTSVLSACASLGDVDYGKWVHEYVLNAKIKWDTHIGTAIIDMYSKCGYIETALEVFDGIRIKNVFTWNALLNGLAIHGHGDKSVKYFEEMVKLGFKPNEVTFLAVLNACCHSGLVEEGRRYFYKMQKNGINPKIEHYGCFIDLLCRAGLINEAIEIVKSMPVKPDVLICGAILSSCKSKGTLMEIPQEILDSFLEIEVEEEDSGVYVLLSNIFAVNKRWDDVEKIRKLMKVKGILKVPGASSAIDV